MAAKTVLFYDLDNTMYSKLTGVSAVVTQNMAEWVARTYNMTVEAALVETGRLYRKYGLTVRGLQKEYGQVDVEAMLAAAHVAVPIEQMIHADERLRGMMLAAAPHVEQWVLTNSDKTHVERVLRVLGVRDLVKDIVWVNPAEPGYTCKPEEVFYNAAAARAGVTAKDCVFVDDSPLNCAAAKALGWTVVLCDAEFAVTDWAACAHHRIRDISELQGVLPELFVAGAAAAVAFGTSVNVAASEGVSAAASSDGAVSTGAVKEESLEDLCRLLKKQIKTTNWVESNPAQGESFATIAARK